MIAYLVVRRKTKGKRNWLNNKKLIHRRRKAVVVDVIKREEGWLNSTYIAAGWLT